MKEKFIINNNFLIDTNQNSLKNLSTFETIRLEPRVVKLLELLIAHKNTILTRATIFELVWDNFGSANEGLNQAVSYLRKILNDKNKSIIITIPKKGYILNADIQISNENFENLVTQNRTHFFRSRLRFATVVLFSIFTLSIIFALIYKTADFGPEKPFLFGSNSNNQSEEPNPEFSNQNIGAEEPIDVKKINQP